jgi:hypothetical protein
MTLMEKLQSHEGGQETANKPCLVLLPSALRYGGGSCKRRCQAPKLYRNQICKHKLLFYVYVFLLFHTAVTDKLGSKNLAVPQSSALYYQASVQTKLISLFLTKLYVIYSITEYLQYQLKG